MHLLEESLKFLKSRTIGCIGTSDKIFTYIGPLLYNKTVIAYNKNKPDSTRNLQSRFLKPFKTAITKHLLGVQALEPDVKSWRDVDFALYQNS